MFFNPYTNNILKDKKFHQFTFPCYPCHPCEDVCLEESKVCSHTPLLLEWSPYSLPQHDDPPITCYMVEPVILAPRYYLEIHPPKNLVSERVVSETPIEYPIDKQGLLANKLQISLYPSIGSKESVDSYYKVNYWQWTKVYPDPNINCNRRCNPLLNKTPVTKHIIRTEFWYIPSIDCSQTDYYELLREDDDTRCLDNTDIIIPPYNLEVFYINSLVTNSDYNSNDWVLRYMEHNNIMKSITNERIVKDIGIAWTYGPRPNTEYYIEYIKPLKFKDIIIKSYDRFSTNSSNIFQ